MRMHILRLCLLASVVHATLVSAEPAATSSYRTDPQSSHVEDATSRGVGQVNFITCLMSAMRPDALVNQGDYVALVDQSKCETGAQTDGTARGAFTTAYVNATRASNSDPMISRIWLEEEVEEGQKSTIFVRVSATEAPSAANPYGKFRLDYCGAGQGGACAMNGYLEGSDTGMRYFEDEGPGENGGGPRIKAVQLTTVGTTSGSGRMLNDNEEGTATFDFAFNSTLFRRKADGSDDQCFSRDATDPDTGMSVWRYGLYDADTGARITRNSGFPIEYTVSGTTHRGYLGYYGLSLPPAATNSMTSGSTVQKVDYSSNSAPTKTDYTVVKAAGKLMKFTRRTRTLREIDRVKFNTFVGHDGATLFAGATANTNYELYWDDAAGNFKATGFMSCGNNGCMQSSLPSEQTVNVAYWQSHLGVQGYSSSLGGEVFIALNGISSVANSAAVTVVYRVQDLVYPSQMPDTLYCLRDCPTSASLASYFSDGSQAQSPFVIGTYNNFSPVSAGNEVVYHTDKAAALLKDTANQSVVFTDSEAMEQRPQYRNGLRSGRLFTELAAAQCSTGSGTYCELKVGEQEVYYQWETGPSSHNQFAAVKDSSNEFVKFDAPLQVNYSVPNEAKYGEYAGQKIVLQYAGFGDLWGIPGHCVSPSTNEVVECNGENVRYVAAFAIPFNAEQGRVTAGDKTYLVKWLDREIRFARKSVNTCVAAGLDLPTGIVLPTSAELKNPSNPAAAEYIGAKPTVTAAPRVIHGEVKY